MELTLEHVSKKYKENDVVKDVNVDVYKRQIFISALSDEDNQLKAFELGADDFITKPFLPSVLYAKCLAICKRQDSNSSNYKTFSHIQIDYNNHEVLLDGQVLELTHKEYLLLE